MRTTKETIEMKSPNPIWVKLQVAALSAIVLGMTAGCVGPGLRTGSLGDVLGLRVVDERREITNVRNVRNGYNDYVYYPRYDVYYNRNTSEFLSVENGRWVTRTSPRNATTQQVLRSRGLSINEYDSPAHHRYVISGQGTRYGYQGNNWQNQPVSNRYSRNPGRY